MNLWLLGLEWGKEKGKRIIGEFGMDMYTLLYFKWVANKDLLYSMWDSVQCYVADWVRKEFGREWLHVYVGLSPFTVHLKLSQHCCDIGYTPIQNKKLKKIKNRKKNPTLVFLDPLSTVGVRWYQCLRNERIPLFPFGLPPFCLVSGPDAAKTAVILQSRGRKPHDQG